MTTEQTKTNLITLTAPIDGLIAQIRDPYDQSVTHLETVLPFSEANKLVGGNANVRQPKTASRPYRKMIETVEESPQSFSNENRGIVFVCEQFEVDPDLKNVSILVSEPLESAIDNETVADAAKTGIVDGSHTFAVVANTVERMEELKTTPQWKEPYVRVKIITANASDFILRRVVEGLNTSTQVKDYTIDDYRNEFTPLKVALTNAGFDIRNISWRENEPGEWDVREILQRLACFLPDKPNIGYQMYKSRQRALKLYIESKELFEPLFPIITDLAFLPEYVESAFSSRENIKQRTRFGAMRVVKQLAKEHTYPGVNITTKHKLDLAATLPVAGAFRELLVQRGKRVEWEVDWREAFKRGAEDLYRNLADVLATITAGTVSGIGSNTTYWTSCANVMLRVKSDMLREGAGSASPKPVVDQPKKLSGEDFKKRMADAKEAKRRAASGGK